MKKYLSIAVVCVSAMFVQQGFAQESLREAVDAGDVAAAQKIVKKGEASEIYCGKLSANDAVKVYEKIFKAMPEESFDQCPTQFAYGYGSKVCSNGNALNTCTAVIDLLFKESLGGSDAAIDALDKTVKAALKVKNFVKPVKEDVDTTAWVACPKKGDEKAACLEQCKAQADSLNDEARKVSCEKKPEHFVETTISVSKPSPLFEKMRTGVMEGYWNAPMSVAEKFAKLMQSNAKGLSIPDTAIPNINYVKRWAESHKADSTALPGGALFRFCTAWEAKVNEILTTLGFETRCPVFDKFEDPRDKQVYKMKNINGIEWFVQNMNFAIDSLSMCYDENPDNCKTFGRLYTHEAAQSACPEGTRLATDEDWKNLESFAGGSIEAALKLRSNGTDDYAFTAMFGGHANKSGHSIVMGEGAYFWIVESSDASRGMARSLFSSDKEVSSISVDKGFFLSVRCIKNESVAVDVAPAESAEVPADK